MQHQLLYLTLHNWVYVEDYLLGEQRRKPMILPYRDLVSVRQQICLASKLNFDVKTPAGNIQRLWWGGLHLTDGSTTLVVQRLSLIDI